MHTSLAILNLYETLPHALPQKNIETESWSPLLPLTGAPTHTMYTAHAAKAHTSDMPHTPKTDVRGTAIHTSARSLRSTSGNHRAHLGSSLMGAAGWKPAHGPRETAPCSTADQRSESFPTSLPDPDVGELLKHLLGEVRVRVVLNALVLVRVEVGVVERALDLWQVRRGRRLALECLPVDVDQPRVLLDARWSRP